MSWPSGCSVAPTERSASLGSSTRRTQAGKEAGVYGREVESSQDTAKLEAMEKAGKLKRIPFKDRAEMEKLVAPVMAAYAKEIGADDIYNKIAAIK